MKLHHKLSTSIPEGVKETATSFAEKIKAYSKDVAPVAADLTLQAGTTLAITEMMKSQMKTTTTSYDKSQQDSQDGI